MLMWIDISPVTSLTLLPFSRGYIKGTVCLSIFLFFYTELLVSAPQIMRSIATVAAALGAAVSVSAVTIAEINGNRFMSPWQDKDVKGIEGVVTAISKTGIYLRSTKPDDNPVTSEGLFVYYGKTAVAQVKVGNVVSLNGVVKEFRYETEMTLMNVVVNGRG